MARSFIVLASVLALLASPALAGRLVRDMAQPCLFTGPTGNVYNFESLETTDGYSAKDPSSYTFYYNFCGGVVEGSGDLSCGTGTAVCQGDETLTNYYSCGTVGSAVYTEVAGGVDVVYTGGADARQSTAHLTCQQGTTTPVMTAQGETTQKEYDITVTTQCACPNGCGAAPPPPPGPGGSSGKLSAGSVLLIIFFVLLFVYFAAGMLFKKYKMQAEGAEIVPNKDFWTSLPGLIKEGFLFSISKCKRDGSYSSL